MTRRFYKERELSAWQIRKIAPSWASASRHLTRFETCLRVLTIGLRWKFVIIEIMTNRWKLTVVDGLPGRFCEDFGGIYKERVLSACYGKVSSTQRPVLSLINAPCLRPTLFACSQSTLFVLFLVLLVIYPRTQDLYFIVLYNPSTLTILYSLWLLSIISLTLDLAPLQAPSDNRGSA